MNTITHLTGIALSLLLFSSSIFAQNHSKTLFPKNKNAQWLLSHFGKSVSAKTMKKFQKKFGGEFEKDDYEHNYRSSKDGMTYQLPVRWYNDATNTYDGLFLEQSDSPVITFLGETKESAIVKKLKANKDFEYWGNVKEEEFYAYHPMKSLISIVFNDDGSIYNIGLSKEAYFKQKISRASQAAFAKSNKHFKIEEIKITKDLVHLYNPDDPNLYQIGHLRYRGKLKNGVPDGKAEWGLFSKDELPRYNSSCDIAHLKGSFKDGKPVGVHKGEEKGKEYIYTYEDGVLVEKKTTGYLSRIVYPVKEEKVDKNTFMIGVMSGVKYYGPVDDQGKPHNEKAEFILGSGKKIQTAVVGGEVKMGSPAFFTIDKNNTTVTTQVDESLRMHGKAVINSDLYTATAYYINGDLDFSKPIELKLNNFPLSDDLKGQATINGYLSQFDFDTGNFAGNDLNIVFSAFPNTRFKGSFKLKKSEIFPIGWHTATESTNGQQGTLKGRYSPKGGFVSGNNIYAQEEKLVYDDGTFTDSRNDKTYRYKTFSKENGTFITWMLDNVYNENYTNDVWEYNPKYGSRRSNCYYTRSKSYSVCPNSWRLPTKRDVQEIFTLNTDTKKRSITDNQTLILYLDLTRDGHIYRRGYQEEFRGPNSDINFWLDDGYTSITKLDQGTNGTNLDEELRSHVCRCVKDGTL